MLEGVWGLRTAPQSRSQDESQSRGTEGGWWCFPHARSGCGFRRREAALEPKQQMSVSRLVCSDGIFPRSTGRGARGAVLWLARWGRARPGSVLSTTVGGTRAAHRPLFLPAGESAASAQKGGEARKPARRSLGLRCAKSRNASQGPCPPAIVIIRSGCCLLLLCLGALPAAWGFIKGLQDSREAAPTLSSCHPWGEGERAGSQPQCHSGQPDSASSSEVSPKRGSRAIPFVELLEDFYENKSTFGGKHFFHQVWCPGV